MAASVLPHGWGLPTARVFSWACELWQVWLFQSSANIGSKQGAIVTTFTFFFFWISNKISSLQTANTEVLQSRWLSALKPMEISRQMLHYSTGLLWCLRKSSSTFINSHCFSWASYFSKHCLPVIYPSLLLLKGNLGSTGFSKYLCLSHRFTILRECVFQEADHHQTLIHSTELTFRIYMHMKAYPDKTKFNKNENCKALSLTTSLFQPFFFP